MKGSFKEYTINNLNLRNRSVMAPMCMYNSKNEGYANDFHVMHYGARSIGGVGSIIVEATAIEHRGRSSSNDLVIWDDSRVTGGIQIGDSIKKYWTVDSIKLGHAGRECTILSEDVIGQSAII